MSNIEDNDTAFLKSLNITPAPEIEQSYQASKEIPPMNLTSYSDLNDTVEPLLSSLNSPDFSYYDEYPEDDPFTDTDGPLDTVEYDIEDPIYRASVTADLVDSIQQFLTFSSIEDLYSLIKNIR